MNRVPISQPYTDILVPPHLWTFLEPASSASGQVRARIQKLHCLESGHPGTMRDGKDHAVSHAFTDRTTAGGRNKIACSSSPHPRWQTIRHRHAHLPILRNSAEFTPKWDDWGWDYKDALALWLCRRKHSLLGTKCLRLELCYAL